VFFGKGGNQFSVDYGLVEHAQDLVPVFLGSIYGNVKHDFRRGIRNPRVGKFDKVVRLEHGPYRRAVIGLRKTVHAPFEIRSRPFVDKNELLYHLGVERVVLPEAEPFAQYRFDFRPVFLADAQEGGQEEQFLLQAFGECARGTEHIGLDAYLFALLQFLQPVELVQGQGAEEGERYGDEYP